MSCAMADEPTKSMLFRQDGAHRGLTLKRGEARWWNTSCFHALGLHKLSGTVAA